MSDGIDAVFAEWSLPLALTTVLVLSGCVYLRGWLALRKTRRAQFTVSRLSCFLLGLAALWVAIASPLDEFADILFSAHMVQHLILISVAPPLILLGWPVVPLLRGVPASIFRLAPGPLLRLPWLRRLGHWLVSPVVAWMIMNSILIGWHVPAAYDFALQHEFWHDFEHICFLAGSIIFWWCIIQPWPSRTRRSWMLLVYLLSADLVNTALSAFLAFFGRPVYSYYVTRPNPFHIAPLSDQTLGAVIMWMVGSFVFLVPSALLSMKLMQTSIRSHDSDRTPHGYRVT